MRYIIKTLTWKYPFIVLLVITLVILVAFTIVGGQKCWPLADPDGEGFWLLVAAVLAVVTFINERMENLASRRIEIQLEFFDRWQKLKTNIEKLEKDDDQKDGERLFRRYFELLSLENLMHKHISPRVWKDWDKSREIEFEEDRKYAGNTYSQWWQQLSCKSGNKDFVKRMNECLEAVKKD